MEQFHGTTIVSARRGARVALGGDGQVTFGNVVLKASARKVRRLYEDKILAGFAGGTAYAASKAGLIGLTKTLARELASRGITVNAVAPGLIETDMTTVLSEEIRQNILKNVPLGKLGEPDDIAGAVAYLASAEAKYITGQVLTVDGGMVM